MKAQLQTEDSYQYNQTSIDIDELLRQQGVSPGEASMKREKERYQDEVTWFNENLKKKVE